MEVMRNRPQTLLAGLHRRFKARFALVFPAAWHNSTMRMAFLAAQSDQNDQADLCEMLMSSFAKTINQPPPQGCTWNDQDDRHGNDQLSYCAGPAPAARK